MSKNYVREEKPEDIKEETKEEVKEEKKIKQIKACHTTTLLNMRSGPSKNHKIIGVIPGNASVSCDPDDYDKAVKGWQNGYVKVTAKIDGKNCEGYCSINYLR